MRLLVIGGTSFVGRAISWAALEHGHEVSVINRGQTPSDLPASVERLVGDRSEDLGALRGRDFDATIDCTAYRPRDVEVLFDALGERGGHHLQISSVSAYAGAPRRGATEAELDLWGEEGLDLDGPITGETYGPLKAACERVALERFAEVAIVRPTYVVGAHDKTLRFPYWVERARRGGTLAVPGPADSPLQWIDARDLAQLVVHLLATGYVGALHACGPYPAPSYLEVVERIVRHVAPEGTRVALVDPERVRAADLESSFPLWSGPEAEAVLDLDNARAVHHGLVTRPLEESVDETLAWWDGREWPAHWLDAAREAELLG